MFVARLDTARSESKESFSPIIVASKKANSNQYQQSESKTCCIDKLDAKNEDKASTLEKSKILEKFSEYLFDLFDANCTEDFKTIEAFESKARKEFRNYDTLEFTHQQYRLHEEFVELFEQLIESFLFRENYSIDAFYTELQHHLKLVENVERKSLSKHCFDDDFHEDHASEVVEVVNAYMNFEYWAELMFDSARQEDRFAASRSLKTQLFEAAVSDKEMSELVSKASKHRLADCC